MMKKIFLMILCILLLGGCAQDQTPGTTEAAAHTHTAGDQWDRNGTEHWKLCACGEKLDIGQHELTDDICDICGSEVWLMDGMADVYNYNEFGETVRWSSYDGAGSVLADWVYEFEYDADGNLLRAKTYESGVLTEESEYAMASGENILVRSVSHAEDGSWYVNEYDRYGNVTLLQSFDADGNLVMEGIYEFPADFEGLGNAPKVTERYADGTSCVTQNNEYGDQVSRIVYDASGNVETEEIYEWEYDEQGNWLSGKVYENGVLTHEISFAVGEDEFGVWTYADTITEYFEDGGKTVSTYDVNEELIGAITYDAAGNKVE